MGATKYQTYTEQQIEYAKFFKALGHPARIAVIENLMKSSGEAYFKELFENIDLAQSTKSEHLKQLTDLGIVDTRLETIGNRSCLKYRLNKNALKFINKFIESIHRETNKRVFKLNNFYSAYSHHIDWGLVWDNKFQT